MEDGKKKATDVSVWLRRLQREQDAHKKYRDRAKDAVNEYQRKPEKGYPIFWSNTKVTQSAVFNRPPKPDVRRRQTNSKADKNLALAVERSIAYQQDTTPFFEHAQRSVTEFLVAGLGVTRLYLKTETESQPVLNPLDQSQIEDPQNPGQPLMEDQIVSQHVPLEYVPYDLFRWEPCKDWEDCGWVSFDRWMSADEINREYGTSLVDKSSGDDGSKDKPSGQKYANLLLVHEIWDDRSKQVIHICGDEKTKEPLKVEDDPYRLEHFFPCPRPMLGNVVIGELTPCPDYFYISEMCKEIDELTERIRALIKGIKDVGFYDSAFTELARMMEETDGARIPVAGLIQKLQGSNLNNVLALEDITSKATVLVQLVGERERAKLELFELTGIADIQRGATKASETLGAQQIKQQWTNTRLTDKVSEISRHFRDVFRIMGEMVSEHFDPQQLTAQSGVEITPEMEQVLKSDLFRCYAIDIEADSTIAQDEAEQKQEKTEFLDKFMQAVANGSQMVAQGFLPADVYNQVLLMTLSAFKHGRLLEEAVEQMPNSMQQLQEAQGQAQQATQQAEQVQMQAQQTEQQMAAQMQELQKQAQTALAEQQRTIEQLSQQLQKSEMQVSMMKQLETMAKTRDINAAATLKEEQAAATAREGLYPPEESIQ
jgi:hypothetical protein